MKIKKFYQHLLVAIAANDSAAHRTKTFDLFPDTDYVTLKLSSVRVAHTALTMVVSVSIDNGLTWATITTDSITGGVVTKADATFTKTTSVSDSLLVEFPAKGYTSVKVVMSATDGTTDALTLTTQLRQDCHV
jgi:hypothetical protein